MKRRVPCVIHGPGTTTMIGSVVLDLPPRTASVRATIIDAATHRGWPAVREFALDTIGPVTVMPVIRGMILGAIAMDEILASVDFGNGKSLHIATLARETVIEAGAEHLGFDGYFLFEACDDARDLGIDVLGKVASFEAAMRLIDVWAREHQSAG